MFSILVSLLLITVGIVLLYKGADLLIDGATKLARNVGLPLIAIGFTIVALGTSLPEFVVGVFAGLAGQNELVLGNILGSNMANFGLALGLAAIISGVAPPAKNNRLELLSLLLALSLLYMLLRDGNLNRPDGLILVLFGVAFSCLVLWNARRENKIGQLIEKAVTVQNRRARIQNLLSIIVGLLLLLVGARITVANAVTLATGLGISEMIIGITILAIGTSLPEIVTTVLASRRDSNPLSIGNIVGSNVLNVLIILGATVIISPIQVKSTVWRYDLPFLFIVSIFVVSLLHGGRGLRRLSGILLVISYFAYVLFALIVRAT